MIEHELALRDLDQRTPEFFVQEMFAHADLTSLELAKKILREGLGSRDATVILKDVLEILPPGCQQENHRASGE